MIQSLKDLEKLLKLCRKQGVTEISTSEVSLKLGELPSKVSSEEIDDNELDDNELVLPAFDEPLTNEELTRFANGEELWVINEDKKK